MIPINKNPLGTEETNPYTPNEILCDINNGATKELEFYPGIYYIRGQGGGAGGGNNNYWSNGGGVAGAPNTAGTGGIYTLINTEYYSIIESIILLNGEDGNISNAGSGSRCYGGNSVLTKDGRGDGSQPATKPGAGGGGQIQWGAAGQPGMYGELLIKYIGKSM